MLKRGIVVDTFNFTVHKLQLKKLRYIEEFYKIILQKLPRNHHHNKQTKKKEDI